MKFLLPALALVWSDAAFAKYLFTGQYGQYSYTGKSVTAMNDRVVSTATLDAKYKLGISAGFVASAQLALGKSAFVFDVSVSRFQESHSFKSEIESGPQVSTAFAGTQATFALGTQIWPKKTKASRNAPDAGRPRKKLSKREIYSNLFLGGGFFLGQHDYAFRDDLRVTDVSYSTKLTHSVYGGTLRVGMNVIPNLDLITDFSGYQTRLQSSSHTLNTFTVEQQDQRFSPAKANLKSLTDQPFTILRLAIGLAFTP